MARKQKMKVYHGIPKSITDEHTIFYNSFDGTLKPQIGLFRKSDYTSRENYNSQATGYGMKPITPWVLSTLQYDINSNIEPEAYTIDFWADFITGASWIYRGICACYGTEIIYNKGNLLIGHWENPIVIPYLANTNLHHIRVIVRYATLTTREVEVYINGKFITKQTKPYKFINEYKILGIGHGTSATSQMGISDLHISNIDRGDYFPNLPQDFIEGKAIIRPRMGQQQIKGDPMCSQMTTLKVDTDPGDNMYKGGVDAGFQRHTYKPELSLTSSNFENNTSIRIKGLGGEIIGGIIDGDTALCVITSSNVSAQQWSVDDVSKLKVGDTVVCITPDFNHVSPTGSIAEIDASTNTIKLSSPLQGYEALKGYYILETTALTSSPTVKTQSGVTVNGTWSGLGTNQATFVLGNNASLKGQDLYIEYSLTMLHGNSDFNELPFAAEKAWGENGIEMQPVDGGVSIWDDFKGKIKGSIKECPHISKYRLFNSLSLPSDITEEISINNIYSVSDPDSVTTPYTDGRQGYFPQQLFSFNLIEMVERKLGCEIPSANKAQWLRDNLTKTSFDIWGYGVHAGGNKFSVSVYLPAENKWLTPWYHTANSITKIPAGTNSVYTPKCIDDNGFMHYIAYTEASDGSTNSTIYIDYVALEIKLEIDPTFVVLYCENTRAREDKCNPVLIQRETKTVKRYLPSKECFVTECTFAPIPSANIVKPLANKLTSRGRYFLTSKGTGRASVKTSGEEYLGQLLYKNLLYRYSGNELIEIPAEKLIAKSSNNDYYNFYTMFELLGRPDTFQSLLNSKGSIGYVSSHGAVRTLSSHLDLIPTHDDISNYYALGLNLVEYRGEIYLVVINSPGNLLSTMSSNSFADMYKLPNRPLIK